MHGRIPYILLFILAISLFSCKSTKYLPEDEYLMDSYKIEAGKGNYDSRRLNDYVKQKPNKRIIFWKFYLSLYNLSSPEKENGFNNWLRRIGEPPAIYDEDLKARSTDQLNLYMQNKGFYDADITDTTIIKKRKAKVYYTVVPNEPYRIRSINYFFQDATLAPMILADTTSNNFKSGELFDVDVLQEERVRIETLLRDSGYYAFNRDYINFSVDSSFQNHQVDITLDVRNYPKQNSSGRITHVDHPVFKIRKVYLITDYDAMSNVLGEDSAKVVQKDTVLYDGVHIVYGKKPNIRPGVVTQKNYIIPNALYDASDVQRTYRNLSSLSAFSKVNIRFTEVESDSSLLDCDVIVAPSTKQAYQLKLEGTNSAGNIGAAANVSYRHRNLFGGSEQFDLSFKGAIEALSENISEADSTYSGLNLMQEFGVEARLRIPKFLLPFKSEQFIRKYNPQTNLRLSYNYQKRPDYIRTLANASFGYEWRGNEKTLHKVYPVEASLILTPYKSQGFQDWLEGKYLFYSYEPHLIIDTRYSVIWTNQKLLKNQNFQDIRLNLETAGNMLYAGYALLAPDPGDDNYQLLGVDFAQYLKADIDFRSYTFLYEDVLLVLRGFAGVGYAYLNSTAMPFEKQYFAGGANSIRAWQVKSLGPGSYEDPAKSVYPNQTGDVKLEANMEYRFKLFWKLEAALFMDVGNIWSLSAVDDREGAGFEFNRFYKELAVGTGAGARFVSSFFVFRFDLGIPLRNPYPIAGYNWLPGNRGISWQDLTFNLAIGYPF